MTLWSKGLNIQSNDRVKMLEIYIYTMSNMSSSIIDSCFPGIEPKPVIKGNKMPGIIASLIRCPIYVAITATIYVRRNFFLITCSHYIKSILHLNIEQIMLSIIMQLTEFLVTYHTTSLFTLCPLSYYQSFVIQYIYNIYMHDKSSKYILEQKIRVDWIMHS